MLASEMANVLDKLASVADDDATMERMTAACIRSLQKVAEAADWVMHCWHDIGKSGDPPTEAEMDDARDAMLAALASARKDGWLP